MIACVNVVIDKVDEYDRWYRGNGLYRNLSTVGLRYASDDIDGIEQAAIECVDIVDKHRHTK